MLHEAGRMAALREFSAYIQAVGNCEHEEILLFLV